MADWLKIKSEYISTDISMRDLAKKHDVSFSSLSKKATRERWKDDRTETGNKVATKVKQKIVSVSVAKEVDRLSRILAVNDTLLEKAERGVSELGEYYIVKRKVSRTEPVKNQGGVVIGIADVDETAEVATKGPAIVDGAAVRHFAAALKDLNEIAKVVTGTGGEIEDLTPLATLLNGDDSDDTENS